MMHDIPWGVVAVFTLLCLAAILAFAENVTSQRAMRRDIREIRDAVQNVARKAGERLSNLEGQMDQFSACPTKDRRALERRHPDDWMVDSNFAKPSERKTQ